MPTIFKDPKPTVEFDGQDYRYTWQYTWDAQKPRAAWLMMNPSWADQNQSDMTIDRVLHFSSEHGCGSAIVVNLWPMVTADSGALWQAVPMMAAEKIEANIARIAQVSRAADLKVVAFGVEAGRRHKAHVLRILEVFGNPLLCLGTSKNGWPYHPLVRGGLRIPNDRKLIAWNFPR